MPYYAKKAGPLLCLKEVSQENDVIIEKMLKAMGKVGGRPRLKAKDQIG